MSKIDYRTDKEWRDGVFLCRPVPGIADQPLVRLAEQHAIDGLIVRISLLDDERLQRHTLLKGPICDLQHAGRNGQRGEVAANRAIPDKPECAGQLQARILVDITEK